MLANKQHSGINKLDKLGPTITSTVHSLFKPKDEHDILLPSTYSMTNIEFVLKRKLDSIFYTCSLTWKHFKKIATKMNVIYSIM